MVFTACMPIARPFLLSLRSSVLFAFFFISMQPLKTTLGTFFTILHTCMGRFSICLHLKIAWIFECRSNGRFLKCFRSWVPRVVFISFWKWNKPFEMATFSQTSLYKSQFSTMNNWINYVGWLVNWFEKCCLFLKRFREISVFSFSFSPSHSFTLEEQTVNARAQK